MVLPGLIFHPKEKVHVGPKWKTKVFPNDEDADRKLNNEIYSLIADMAPTHRQADSSFTGGSFFIYMSV